MPSKPLDRETLIAIHAKWREHVLSWTLERFERWLVDQIALAPLPSAEPGPVVDVAAILREFADDDEDDACPQCSRLVMCRFHSLLSMLHGRTAPLAEAQPPAPVKAWTCAKCGTDLHLPDEPCACQPPAPVGPTFCDCTDVRRLPFAVTCGACGRVRQPSPGPTPVSSREARHPMSETVLRDVAIGAVIGAVVVAGLWLWERWPL